MIEAVGSTGRVIVDDYFVTIIKDGVGGGVNRVMTRLQSGFAGEKRIPMDTIASVQFRAVGSWGESVEGFTEKVGLGGIGKQLGTGNTGYIQFGIFGASENKSRAFGAALNGLSRDENTIMFSKSQEETFARVRDFVDAKIMERMTGKNATTSSVAPSRLEQLKQLAELRDAGVLTQEEFEAEKAKVLAS